jgi:TRAP transporter 4TM/12TM fusion protein
MGANNGATGSEGQAKIEHVQKLNLDMEDVEISSQRKLSGNLAKFITIWAVIVAALHIFSMVFYPVDPWKYRSFHVASLSFLGFLLFPGWQKAGSRVHWSDWVFAVASMAVFGYIVYHHSELIFRIGIMPTTADYIIAVTGIILVLELTRRTAGMALPILVGVFLLYTFIGPYLPGIMHNRSYAPERMFTFIYSQDGVFSIPVDISSTFLIMFIIFASFLQVSGVGKYFVEWAFSISGHLRGGPAKVAVLSSALMGTMSGTSVGNVVATGSFTIPLMRKVGYSPQFAAATEAVASTGGQIMPPIMGAGVFIMAELTGIPYSRLMLAGIIPAVLYFASCYMMVDLEAIKQRLHGIPRHLLPGLKEVMSRSYMFLPVLVLFGMLLFGFSVVMAGFWAIISAFLISWTSKKTRMGLKDIMKALEGGARGTIQMMAVCASAGIIVGVIALTGVGLRFSSVILGIAGESTFLALLFTMGIVIILGMGMPTTAAYAVAAAVVAPGLIGIGIEPLMAHFFIFYFACVSAITPPVALAAYAGAAISGSEPMKTGYTAFRLGIAAYIVPFMFFYAPEILMIGSPTVIILRTVTALVGIYALATAVQGYFFGHAPLIIRALLLVASYGLVTPNELLDIIGLALLLVLFIVQRAIRKTEDTDEASSGELKSTRQHTSSFRGIGKSGKAKTHV